MRSPGRRGKTRRNTRTRTRRRYEHRRGRCSMPRSTVSHHRRRNTGRVPSARRGHYFRSTRNNIFGPYRREGNVRRGSTMRGYHAGGRYDRRHPRGIFTPRSTRRGTVHDRRATSYRRSGPRFYNELGVFPRHLGGRPNRAVIPVFHRFRHSMRRYNHEDPCNGSKRTTRRPWSIRMDAMDRFHRREGRQLIHVTRIARKNSPFTRSPISSHEVELISM